MKKIISIIGEVLFKIGAGFVLPILMFFVWKLFFAVDFKDPETAIGGALFSIMFFVISVQVLGLAFRVIGEIVGDIHSLITKGKIGESRDRIIQRMFNGDKGRIEIERKYKKLKELQLPLEFAHKSLYQKWLRGYLNRRGKITHHYDFEFENHDWFQPINNDCTIKLDGYYGANSFNLLIPEEFRGEVVINDLGHCNVYDLRDFSCKGNFVPGFRNLSLEIERS